MPDTYISFEDLSSKEKEDIDFRIETEDRNTYCAIVGIHGGQIEPGTEEVVRAVAGDDISYYLFLGTERHQHITSSHFDEGRCLTLIKKSTTVISIHGKKGQGEFIMLGGLDTTLITTTTQLLQDAGFTLQQPEPSVEGTQKNNICNRALSGKGMQVELSRSLRDSFLDNDEKMNSFATIIRDVARYSIN